MIYQVDTTDHIILKCCIQCHLYLFCLLILLIKKKYIYIYYILHYILYTETSIWVSFRLSSCNLTSQSCEIVASALQSSNCVLRELDLSNNDMKDSGVKLLSDGLKRPNCQLQILRYVKHVQVYFRVEF